MRRWFSWLVRFRGLTPTCKDADLDEIELSELDDRSRKSKFGGLDSTWATDLKLNTLAGELKGKPRLTLEKLRLGEDSLSSNVNPVKLSKSKLQTGQEVLQL